MNRKLFLMLFAFSVPLYSFSQTTINQILKEVEKNNKSLIAEKQYWASQKLSYRTGMFPENPKAEIDYMVGRPVGAGNQRDIVITQGFDFPTAYGKRKRVSTEQGISADHQVDAFRQELLLQAHLLCIDYIYSTKVQQKLTERLRNADQLLAATEEQTKRGESNILDLNKIRLLQLEIKSQSDLNNTTLKSLQHRLNELNGGIPIDVTNLTYPIETALSSFEELDSLIEANDPVVKAVKQEKEISATRLALTKALTLPKIEGGYHQQAILGQTYEGFHIGMTVPLWENKNRVKTEKAKVMHSELAIQEHRTQHYYDNKQLYEHYLQWRQTYQDYVSIIESANNEALLKKAFDHGEISLIEYLMESRYFYSAVDKFLEAEKSLQETRARLLKFEL